MDESDYALSNDVSKVVTEASKELSSIKRRRNKSITSVVKSQSSVDSSADKSSDKNNLKNTDSVMDEGAGPSQQSSNSNSSKRKRIPREAPRRENNTDAYDSTWSELEKQRILIALQRYGVLDVDKIRESVTGRSEEDIRKFINFKWKQARVELVTKLRASRPNRTKLGPIDDWLEILSKQFPNYDHYKTNPIAHAVLLIWKYEKHPDPSECGGIDFKALYEHLYYCLAGYPPKHLNQPTAKYLQETLKNFACHIKKADLTEEVKFLSSPLKINNQNRPPVSEEEVIEALSYTEEQCIEELSKSSGFNPFSVPKELLQKSSSSSP